MLYSEVLWVTDATLQLLLFYIPPLRLALVGSVTSQILFMNQWIYSTASAGVKLGLTLPHTLPHSSQPTHSRTSTPSHLHSNTCYFLLSVHLKDQGIVEWVRASCMHLDTKERVSQVAECQRGHNSCGSLGWSCGSSYIQGWHQTSETSYLVSSMLPWVSKVFHKSQLWSPVSVIPCVLCHWAQVSTVWYNVLHALDLWHALRIHTAQYD